MHVFGCLICGSTPKANRTKFQPRARNCIFIGYLPYFKGYKLLDLLTREIFISRDIVFHEQLFPFHDITTNLKPIDHFPDVALPRTDIVNANEIRDMIPEIRNHRKLYHY